MKALISKEQQKKIAQCMTRLKYKMYQADIRIASHDVAGLITALYGIIYQCRKAHKALKKQHSKKK